MKHKATKNWIPQQGCWIMIKDMIPVDLPIPPLSIWYAVPSGVDTFPKERTRSWYGMDFYNFEGRSLDHVKSMVKMYNLSKNSMNDEDQHFTENILTFYGNLQRQMKIKTPFGDCCIQPEEYIVIKDINKYLPSLDDGSLQLRHMSTNLSFKGKLKEQLFYIRSRGIPINTALGMVSGNVKTQNAFYFLFHPEYIKMFSHYYDHYMARELKWKMKYKGTENEEILTSYFFNEKEALKLNVKYHK